MKSVQIQNGYFLVFERGEEFFTALARFCEEHDIHWAQFSGIGAVEDVEIGYYDLPARQYVFRREAGPFEVSNMDGNIAELNEAPLIHAHTVLARCDESLSTIGGHLKRAVVALTLEVCLWQVSQPLLRRPDDATGLNLIQL
ncbi:MAG TPA: PPC domain-containing DNA-binding protein [Candidatus Paceibacterota bacterium]|nr:PPC domain-containing DNA-binding protein [Candidatus Paceibacterota bacterium]